MLDSENRHHQRLQQYWDTLRAGRPYPNESDLDPKEIQDVWPSCFLVAIDAATPHVGYRYSYLGPEMLEAYGEDQHNPDIVKLLSTDTAAMIAKFNEVVKTGKPVTDDSSFVNLKRINIRYRTCMLPLGGPDGSVSYIMGCMRWKTY